MREEGRKGRRRGGWRKDEEGRGWTDVLIKKDFVKHIY